MPAKVLIVDDEPNIVVSLQFLMKKGGFETSVARDYEVCQQLRSSGWDDLLIVMLTAKGRESEITKGLALGADAYVTKPFSTADLVDTVTRLLGGSD